MKDGEIRLEKANKNKINLNHIWLNEIRMVQKWTKSALYKIETLYQGRHIVVRFWDDYSSMKSEAKHAPFLGKTNLNINSWANASKITNITCTSKSKQYI